MHPLCRLGIHQWKRQTIHGPYVTVIKLQCQRCKAWRRIIQAKDGKWVQLWKVKAMHAAKQQDWQTPPELFEWMQRELGFEFTLDPCTSPDNPLGPPAFFTKEDDGLVQSWAGHKAYVNAPYGDLPLWVEKCHDESAHNDTVVVALLPVRTSPKYMRNYVWTEDAIFLDKLRDARDLQEGEIGIYFLPKRVRFIDPGTGEKTGSPYFDSMVVVWK